MAGPVYPTEKNIHYSLLHGNSRRTPPQQQLFNYMIDELREVLGKENGHPPPPGYEIAWRTFLGVTISGRNFFACHITEQCPAAHIDYCEDLSTVGSPIRLCVEPFHIKSEEMNLIRDNIPKHHRGHVPSQIVLAITQKTSIQRDCDQLSFSKLLHGQDKVFTSNFCAVPMTPEGIVSLSFKTNDFPLGFCTCARQTSLILSAVEKELNKNLPNIDSITLYQEACTLEMCFAKTESEYETNKHKLHLKDNEHRIVSESLFVILNSPNLTPEIKQDLIQRKQEMLAKIKKEIELLQYFCAANQVSLLNQKTAIEEFKKQNRETLPPLYAKTTFQIAINMTFDDGSIIHKQFNNETKNFDLCEDPEKKVSSREFMNILYQD